MKIYNKGASIFFICSFFIICKPIQKTSFDMPMNFVTVADEEHLPWLKILITSILTHNPKKNIKILIIDIGLTPSQIQALNNNIITVIPLEMANPNLTKKFVVRPNGRLARGWYAWKPVAIKQGFEHFDYFLYIDAGKRVCSPCDDIFNAIIEHGYFFFDCGHIIDPMTTSKVKQKFKLNTPEYSPILQQFGLEAGIQGLSKKVYDNYVFPMYLLAHEIEWFSDDGTAPWGFGGSRHDQTLFSIMARLNGYTIHRVCGDGPRNFTVKNTSIPFNRNNYFQFKQFDANPLAKERKLIG